MLVSAFSLLRNGKMYRERTQAVTLFEYDANLTIVVGLSLLFCLYTIFLLLLLRKIHNVKNSTSNGYYITLE